jgi:hypothetical protein
LSTYARWLFGSAAAANLIVAAWLALAQGLFVAVLRLDPITGSNVVIADLAAVLIAAFGYGYLRIALDPVRFRPLIHIGAVGKLAAVATVVAGVMFIPHVWPLALLMSGDAVFAALFLDYLRRTRPVGP